ncbi:L-arabinose 1-dehydrogenase (NAD(P)(+)) (L-AraDH) [Durusdinium trenchii]|uniref:L-arabinose 1-dehydrogenase (NAD(P)(+)) (L-AraDH) n=1 Tax=Durusdinium trenchii TaxID=1381693 RepID=A0ABP0RU26_9DINO
MVQRGRIAITGAGGFLGQLARAECEELGFEVLGIDLASPRCQGGPRKAGSGVANVSKVDVALDMSQEGALVGVLEGCTEVIHLAADGRPSADFISEVLPSNIKATYHLLQEAERAKVKRVIFASTNHTQHGATMALGGHCGTMSWERLQAVGGPASIALGDSLSRAGPDSFYAVSKLTGEAMGYLYSRVHQSFEFVALRIGWCLYDKPTDLQGDACEDYLRCMIPRGIRSESQWVSLLPA